ncbi:hypothetical protein SAMN05421510_102731 [Nitrosomonas ureae]|uniref:Uncharacterized protein n=1 Tax=Nitrosomonas ureae TaxID=44577 RepID=A0A1H9E4P4_9PROT|nr:hypothetical protein SAMN05421510_102731 [Nitrosomonas ureae]SOD22316.1 hypothetical protein SAMN06297164_3429 [Nitrosomonas ureae]
MEWFVVVALIALVGSLLLVVKEIGFNRQERN